MCWGLGYVGVWDMLGFGICWGLGYVGVGDMGFVTEEEGARGGGTLTMPTSSRMPSDVQTCMMMMMMMTTTMMMMMMMVMMVMMMMI